MASQGLTGSRSAALRVHSPSIWRQGTPIDLLQRQPARPPTERLQPRESMDTGTTKSRGSGRISRTDAAVARGLELLGWRSVPRILWELRASPMTFRTLQTVSETSCSVLNARLTLLRARGLVMHHGRGYLLSVQGRALVATLVPLTEWALAWAPPD